MIRTSGSVAARSLKSFLIGGVSIVGLAPLAAQAQDEETEVIDEAVDQAQASDDKIVVTGSRIRRNEFSSSSPIQVIDGQVSRELGLFDTARLLQESTVATGVQVDNTFSGFVLDNGPGAATLSLRGIDPERTLILINGRRVGPGGSEGAPTSPDLNLIPSSLINRVEVLLDGASSVYGSDAVAGVANIILRDDFDGLEIETSFALPEFSGGRTSQVSVNWGVSGDNGFIGVGAEFYRRNVMTVADRGLLCDENIEIDENGVRRSLEVDVRPGTTINTCKNPFTFSRILPIGATAGVGNFNSIFYTPGRSNTGIPNFTDDIDANLDGQVDVDLKGGGIFDTNNPNHPEVQSQDIISQLERIAFMAFGNYEIRDLNNMEAFFEFGYFQRDSTINSGPGQVFPTVFADNPTNPCSFEKVAANPSVCNGIPGDVLPVINIIGDRTTNDATQAQIRLVGGVRGDLPWFAGDRSDRAFGVFDFNNWTYELTGSYQRSLGDSVRRGILEDRFALALRTTTRLPDGSLACGPDFDGDGFPDNIGDGEGAGFLGNDGCTPVNIFADNVMRGFTLTPEEREYLFGVRTFSTEIQQSIINGFITGNVANLPGGQAGLVLGFEYRQDEIVSRPDDVAEDGNFIGFFSDRGATGLRELKEGYGELDLPILRGMPFAEELTMNFSGRVTNESFYGTNWTWSFKGTYRPTEWLTLRGSRGTSFRAPNLREQFFNGATGFQSSLNDPCIVPLDARQANPMGPGNVYDPTEDDRTQTTLDNCRLAGVDPLSLGINGAPSIEVLTGGTTALDAETSRAFTGGFVLDVPFAEMGVDSSFSDVVRMQLSATHFDILVTNTVEEPSLAFLFEDCYETNAGLTSDFCSRIARDPATGFVELVDAGFINIGRVTSRGFDFNALISTDAASIGGDPVDITLDARATFVFEQETQVIDTFDDNIREIGLPRWRGQATLIADWRNWRALWRTRYIGPQVNDEPSEFGQNDTCRAVTGFLPGSPTAVVRDTTDVLCRDVDFVNSYWVSNAAVTWRNDVWSITAGVNNVFDNDPPKVDSAEEGTISAAGNFPLGVGYDFFGRTYTINVRRSF